MSRRDKQYYKKLVIIFTAIFLAICLPVWVFKACDSPKKEPTTKDSAPQEEIIVLPQEKTIMLNTGKEIIKINFDQYLLGALAAEMPALFEIEALKAQAVAARTFAINKQNGAGCIKGGDICTSSNHCQAYKTQEQRKQTWGDNFNMYESKLISAVKDTSEQIVSFEGKPIQALYHSTSGGMTENSENVYAFAFPYLRSVKSDETDAPRYQNTAKFTNKNFADTLNQNGADVNSADLEQQISIKERFESGRVKKVSAGNKTFTGKQIRKLFRLDSTNFTLSFEKGYVTISTKGFGHGVGMSQTGANNMAKKGATYTQILSHYYTDTQLDKTN